MEVKLKQPGSGKRERDAREPLHVLVLEDDPVSAELIKAKLRSMPWVESRLETVGTLAEALAKLASGNFGLVVADLNLPDSAGLATLEALTHAGEQPIIVLTGDDTPALHTGAIQAGAHEFLNKAKPNAAALERMVRFAWLQANTFRSLRESEARFRSLIDLSSDFYWESDTAHRVIQVEQGPRRHPNPRQLGKARWETPSTHPDAAGWAAHRATMDAHLPFNDFEIARLDDDGVERWRSVSGEPLFDESGVFRGYRGIGKDITARKRAEEELRRFRLALDTSPDMILLIDRATMRHVDLNTTACRVLGYSREELLAMGPQDILPLPRAELESIYDRMIADPSTATGMRSYYRCKDGSLLPFESTRRVLRSGNSWLIAAISRDIRERIAAEDAVRESEARFRSLTALSSDWYWEQDAEFRLTYMSSIEKTGLEATAYLGRKRWDQPALNLTEADWDRHRAQLERHEPFRDFEIERPSAGGATVWVSLSGEPVFDAEGRFAGYRGVGRDITARKHSEQEMLRLGRMYGALGAANEAILRAKSPHEMFVRACEIAVAAGGFVLGTVYLLQPHAKTLSRAAASGSAAALVEEIAPSIDESEPGGKGLIGMACRAGQPAISNDYAADPRTEARRRLPRSYDVGSVAVFPLKVEGQLAGVFGLQHAERHAFTNELTALLQRLADNISFAMENFRRETQRRRAQRKLSESEQRFRSLTGLSSDIYWEQDAEYRFTEFVGTVADKIRFGRGMIGKRRWDQEYFNMSEADWAAHRALLEARRPFRDLELGRLDQSGEKIWVSVSGEPFFDEDGHFEGYRGVGKDITARKREAQLRELEHSVTRSLAQADSLQEALRGAIRAVCETEGWDCGRYFSADAKAGVMRFAGAWGVEVEAVQRFIAGSRMIAYKAGEGIAGRVWQSGEPLWVTDVSSDERSAQTGLARATGMRGAFVFPVIAEGRAIGVLGFNSREARRPEERLMQAIGAIGAQIGQFAQRKEAEDVLREREAAHVRYQERIARFGQSALVQREPAELVDEAVQAMLEALGAEAVAYFEAEPGAGRLVVRSLVGVADVAEGVVTCEPGSPALQVMQSGGRVLADGARLPFAWSRGLRSVALIPVRGESKVRGVLCAAYKQPEAFGAEELNFAEAAASILSTALQRIDSEDRLAYLAQFDALTGLPNRALLADRFSQMIVQAKRHATLLAALFIDLDEFKMVNDTLGHAGGDALLKEVAARLQSSVRGGDTVARISGDEFAIVLGDLKRSEDAALVAQKILDRLSAAVEVHGKEVFVTASVGIAVFPGDGADAEALIGAADAAMYRAKQSGRNAYQFYTAEINQRSRARAQMGSELRRALEREEFMLVYQPKYELATRRACGAEALLRWRHPERGLVSPAEFIPVLEETGLIVAVGEWVIRRACKDLKAWQAAGLTAAGPVSVNLSARQFRLQDLDLRIRALVAAAGVDPALIELEITESHLMQDPDHAIRVMRALRDAGMRIAIDDFGTGYSSLAYLTRFPVASLKIDRSFVKNMANDKNDATIVRTVIEMAHSLGFTVVAEGVETEEQANLLRLLRCEQAQGFLFARPMPADELRALLS